MEFPISRDRLQNYRVNEAVLVETKQRVLNEIQNICKDVERVVLTTSDTKYVYRILQEVKSGFTRPSNSSVSSIQAVGILKELVLEIKKVFPDSNIILDPLETYILIDWS